MLVREFYGHNNVLDEDMYKTYSDEGFKIRQIETGIIYDEAIDLESKNYTYEETDIPIEGGEEAQEEDYLEALNELGVSE